MTQKEAEIKFNAFVLGALTFLTTLGKSIITMFLVAVIYGFFFWLFYPIIIAWVAPGAIASGLLVGKLGFWQSALLVLVVRALFTNGGTKSGK